MSKYDRILVEALPTVSALAESAFELEQAVQCFASAEAIERCALDCRRELDRIQKRFVPKLLELDSRATDLL